MQPAEALRRVAFLLEASGAPTYKVRAFRGAAAACDQAGEGELARLAAQGRLESLNGVGKSTAAVITECLAGNVPSYLQALVDQQAPPTAGPGGDLLKALRGDCHSHSNWSDGGSPIHEMAEAAAQLGHEYLVLTDHSPRLTVAHGLSADDLRRQLDVVAEVNQKMAPFRLLSGIEVDILEDGSLDQEEDLLARLDVVVASVHSLLRMESPSMTKRMVRAVSNPHVDILGHCTGRRVLGRGRPESTFDADLVFAACAEHGTAVEVNSRPDRRDPPERLARRALGAGCRFAIDSDAHAPGQLSWLAFGADQATEAGITSDLVINTRPVAELLAWAGRHDH